MNRTFKGTMSASWSITDEGIEYKGKMYTFPEIERASIFSRLATGLTNGVVTVFLKNGKTLSLAFSRKDLPYIDVAVNEINENSGTEEELAVKREEKAKALEGVVYDLIGVRGRHLRVYDNRVVITTQAGLGSLVSGNVSDGEKTIYYSDCIGVQFKESGLQIGYLQLETASNMMNNQKSNFFNENSFTFDASVQTNELMREVKNYIMERVELAKNGGQQQVIQQVSTADELIKFKELLDMGVITQEEFDAKKKQLLGI